MIDSWQACDRWSIGTALIYATFIGKSYIVINVRDNKMLQSDPGIKYMTESNETRGVYHSLCRRYQNM